MTPVLAHALLVVAVDKVNGIVAAGKCLTDVSVSK